MILTRMKARGRLPIVAAAGPENLLKDSGRHGNEGLGKPEPLKHGFQGRSSRRITDEHGLAYRISPVGEDFEVRVATCRYHCE